MDSSKLKKVIKYANLAPSGGNSQPWKFRITDRSIFVSFDPESEHAFLNYKWRGTLIAAGALSVNIYKISKVTGLRVVDEIFTINENDFSIEYVFDSLPESVNTNIETLLEARHTNRNEHVNPSDPSCVLNESENIFPGITVLQITDETKMDLLSNIYRNDVYFTLRNTTLHKLFFKEVLWNEADQNSKPGLYIKTMEIKPPKSFFFRLASKESVIQRMIEKGIVNKIRDENGQKLKKSGGFLAIVIGKEDFEQYYQAGKVMQEYWLNATEQNLAFQPMLGLTFMFQQAQANSEVLTSEEISELNRLRASLISILSLSEEDSVLMFRFGKPAKKASAIAIKRPPRIL